MKKKMVLVFFMLGLLNFWQGIYFEMREHFSGARELGVENRTLRVAVNREKAKTDLANYRFDIFRQNVAKLIPTVKELNSPQGEGVRNLASVVQSENPEFVQLAEVESKIQTIKDHFADRKFKLVIQEANDLLAFDPVTPSLVTIYFMQAESYFQMHELGLCVQVAQKMMKLFPENDKTGLVMLRVGMLLKEKNRTQEAKETWQIVAAAYANKDIRDQAERLIVSVEKVQQ